MAALEDLVRSGRVRYLGVSDTQAWKVPQANVIAGVRSWSAFIGLQVEYSLLERTIEQELVPMADELGLGITPGESRWTTLPPTSPCQMCCASAEAGSHPPSSSRRRVGQRFVR